MDDLVVIAVGGNALIRDKRHMTVLDQYRAAGQTSHHIAGIVRRGHRVLITHGNGPQVGFILLRSEIAKDTLHQVPLSSCVADTQGAIGFQIEQTLSNELRRVGLDREVVAIVTQVVVDEDDPAFQAPTKPVGPFFSETDAEHHRESDGWIIREDAGRGWRRLVASPRPLEIVEEASVRALLDSGAIVIAAGGGGVPVTRNRDGCLRACDAVIDKDFTSALLAQRLGADTLMIATWVGHVALGFGTPEARLLDRMTVPEAEAYLARGEFAEGSMKPKIEASLEFLRAGGKRVIITRPEELEAALDGKAGTEIVP